ncbi:MAG: tRNA guanosine(34) transglycosylase Tgt [Candidatus Paceibacterota bacterium]
MEKPLNFKIKKELSGTLARAGVIETLNGQIQTPAFVTVGTKATVKALTPEQVRETGAQVVLANTYHLYLEPGDLRIKNMGGLAKAMNWKGPTMTDSGGFQVFSLGVAYGSKLGKISNKYKEELLLPEIPEERGPKIASIDPNGVTFRSHLDGGVHYITPEKSIEIQHNLGADIIFAFDECTSPHETLHYQKEALERTHRWAKRSLGYHKSKENSKKQALFGVVQGGRDENLRKESAEFLSKLDFDGFGIGGSFEKEDMKSAVKWCNEILPKDKPRHLLGIGEPEDLFMAVENGCDLFDCVAPTRMGRNGTVYTKTGRLNLNNSESRDNLKPLDLGCTCYTCQNYTRSYLSHLFRSKEMLAGTLATIHNLHFIIHMVDEMRQNLLDGDFTAYKKAFLTKYYGK